tara:strand:- start:1378 stop:1752 length:375 start_codon:yes stop_codon:yes gene_type:complete
LTKKNKKLIYLKRLIMQKIIKEYKITQNKSNNILITFEKITENIEDMELVTFYFNKDIKSLVINYWKNKNIENVYILKSIPKKLIKLLIKKDIILISEKEEEKYLNNLIDKGFHYDCLNQKHLD